MVYIISRSGKHEVKYGKTRAEIEENLRKDDLGSLTDEQLDKCKYLERKSREELGGEIFINQDLIGRAEEITE